MSELLPFMAPTGNCMPGSPGPPGTGDWLAAEGRFSTPKTVLRGSRESADCTFLKRASESVNLAADEGSQP